jgi:hypothetical protein
MGSLVKAIYKCMLSSKPIYGFNYNWALDTLVPLSIQLGKKNYTPKDK